MSPASLCCQCANMLPEQIVGNVHLVTHTSSHSLPTSQQAAKAIPCGGLWTHLDRPHSESRNAHSALISVGPVATLSLRLSGKHMQYTIEQQKGTCRVRSISLLPRLPLQTALTLISLTLLFFSFSIRMTCGQLRLYPCFLWHLLCLSRFGIWSV